MGSAEFALIEVRRTTATAVLRGQPTDVAPRWRRLVAAYLDGIVAGTVLIVLRLIHDNHAARYAGVLIDAAYVTLATSWWGATLGKAALGIRVIDTSTEYPPTGARHIAGMA